MENYKGKGKGYLRDTIRYPFRNTQEFEEWYGLQPDKKCWKTELHDGKENADLITYEKLFSYDDIIKASQDEYVPAFCYISKNYSWKDKIMLNHPMIHEKLFSYDDISKSMQGEFNSTYICQRVLYRLQSKIENENSTNTPNM